LLAIDIFTGEGRAKAWKAADAASTSVPCDAVIQHLSNIVSKAFQIELTGKFCDRTPTVTW
jgi:hypothetical protein